MVYCKHALIRKEKATYYFESLQPAQKKAQRKPHLYSADHAVILGLANTLRTTAEHHKMSSIKQGVCEGEVEYYF